MNGLVGMLAILAGGATSRAPDSGTTPRYAGLAGFVREQCRPSTSARPTQVPPLLHGNGPAHFRGMNLAVVRVRPGLRKGVYIEGLVAQFLRAPVTSI
jgi:hypothetical protein